MWAALGSANLTYVYGTGISSVNSNPLASYGSATDLVKEAESRGVGVATVGNSLLSRVSAQGAAGGDQLLGVMEEMGNWRDIVREQDKATGNWSLVAKTAEASSLLDAMARSRSDVLSAGTKRQDGTVNYYITTTPIYTANNAPTGAAAAAADPPASNITPRK